MSQHIVFNLVFNEDSKMSSAICILKVIVKRQKKYIFCAVIFLKDVSTA
jgi:hypothetical protein